MIFDLAHITRSLAACNGLLLVCVAEGIEAPQLVLPHRVLWRAWRCYCVTICWRHLVSLARCGTGGGMSWSGCTNMKRTERNGEVASPLSVTCWDVSVHISRVAAGMFSSSSSEIVCTSRHRQGGLSLSSEQIWSSSNNLRRRRLRVTAMPIAAAAARHTRHDRCRTISSAVTSTGSICS